jgi:hypothetical protein
VIHDKNSAAAVIKPQTKPKGNASWAFFLRGGGPFRKIVKLLAKYWVLA